MTMHICLASDNNYAKYMATTMASVLCNTTYDVCFHILDGGISDENKSKLKELKKIKPCTINFINMDSKLFAGFPTSEHFPQVTYYRYLVPSLVNADKVLYMDCDIVVAKNIDALWDIDIDGFYIAGVEDIKKDQHHKRTGLNNYVNAGMLLINSALWRVDDITKKLFDYTNAHIDELKYYDQDVINAVCQDRIKILPNIWNYHNQKYHNENARIHHFVGKTKPWIAKTRTVHREIFWKYFLMTAWADEYTWRVKLLQKLHKIRYKIKSIIKG